MRELLRGSAVAELEQSVSLKFQSIMFLFFSFAFDFAYRQTHWFFDSSPPGDK